VFCAGPNCDKSLHMTCCKEKVVKDDMKQLCNKLDNHPVACPKVCLRKAIAINSTRVV
jgi:hypothetical protein